MKTRKRVVVILGTATAGTAVMAGVALGLGESAKVAASEMKHQTTLTKALAAQVTEASRGADAYSGPARERQVIDARAGVDDAFLTYVRGGGKLLDPSSLPNAATLGNLLDDVTTAFEDATTLSEEQVAIFATATEEHEEAGAALIEDLNRLPG